MGPRTGRGLGELTTARCCASWLCAFCQALSKRIHYGKFVAEAKFRAQPEEYGALIRQRDAAGLMRLLTDEAVEAKVCAWGAVGSCMLHGDAVHARRGGVPDVMRSTALVAAGSNAAAFKGGADLLQHARGGQHSRVVSCSASQSRYFRVWPHVRCRLLGLRRSWNGCGRRQPSTGRRLGRRLAGMAACSTPAWRRPAASGTTSAGPPQIPLHAV